MAGCTESHRLLLECRKGREASRAPGSSRLLQCWAARRWDKSPAEFLAKFAKDLNRVFDLQLRISTLVLRAKQIIKLSQWSLQLGEALTPVSSRQVAVHSPTQPQTPMAHPVLLLQLHFLDLSQHQLMKGERISYPCISIPLFLRVSEVHER